MYFRRQAGLSLVELMVALVLAVLTVLVVMQVLSTYESRRRTTMAGNDAEMSAAVGLFMVERDVRMAGAGLTLPGGFACNVGTNLYFDGDVVLDGEALAPLLATDGGAGPDTLRVVRSDSAFGVAPSTVIQAMASSSDDVTVDASMGLQNGHLFLAGAPDGNKICTVMQMTADADADASSWGLAHGSADSLFNPADPDAAFSTPVSYQVGDIVLNLGRFGLRSFTVLCDDGGTPAAGKRCNLVGFDTLAAAAPPTLADSDTLTADVIDFQVQYGVAPAGSQQVNEWVDPSGATWGDPTPANIARIKAVRMAIVARGGREPVVVSPAQLVIWDEGEPTELVRDLSDDERRYRYKVLTVVVPLINVLWAGV